MFLFVGHFLNQNLRVFEEELGQLPVQVPLVLVPLVLVPLALLHLLCYSRRQEDVMVRLVPQVPLVPQKQEVVLVSPAEEVDQVVYLVIDPVVGFL